MDPEDDPSSIVYHAKTQGAAHFCRQLYQKAKGALKRTFSKKGLDQHDFKDIFVMFKLSLDNTIYF
jgi:hypothetical protein